MAREFIDVTVKRSQNEGLHSGLANSEIPHYLGRIHDGIKRTMANSTYEDAWDAHDAETELIEYLHDRPGQMHIYENLMQQMFPDGKYNIMELTKTGPILNLTLQPTK